MLLNKEILTGLYGGGKTNINFNISWSTNFVTITAYDTLSAENYRPRINTWKSDDTNIFPLSAGNQVFDFNAKTFSFPWGDRSNGSTLITIPVKTTQTAGVDIYVDDRSPAPHLVPNISQWVITNTANPNEKKYRYSINRVSNKTQTISATLFDYGFWTFNYTTNKNLYNFSIRTLPANGLLNTLTALWELDETSGTRVDSHGSYNLTAVNSVSSGTGVISGAADFYNDWLISNTTFDLASNGFSVSTWLNGNATNIGPAVSQWAYGFGFIIGIDSTYFTSNEIIFVLGNEPTYYTAKYPNSPGWHHVVATYNPTLSTSKLYVDGILRDTVTSIPSIPLNGSANFKMGTIDNGYEFTYDGLIDSTGLWLRPLTEAEITQLYNNGNGLPYTSFPSIADNNTTIYWGDNTSDVVSSGTLVSHSYTV